MRRFPGPRPYSEDDESLFFGRDDEKKELTTAVRTNKLTVLFGRSGYGKSSLIKAGVVTTFKTQHQYEIIQIRFDPTLALSEQLKSEIKNHCDHDNLFLAEVSKSESLWQLFKTLQWQAKSNKKEGVLLVLDQFEEVFTFENNDVTALARDISLLAYNKMPDEFQALLERKLYESGEDPSDSKFYQKNKEKIVFSNSEIDTRILIGIRSDRLYLLDEIGEQLPGVFTSRFNLKALQSERVKEILTKAGAAKGNFDSPEITFDKSVIGKVKSYLAGKPLTQEESAPIEAFELQIICEEIETRAIAKKKETPGITTITAKQIFPTNLNDVITDHYINIISNNTNDGIVFNEYEQLATRFLIEKKLINSRNQRVCLDKVSILPLIVPDELLENLVKRKIVRKEQNTASGRSYEISHDTLVTPILNASINNGLDRLDEKIEAYYKKAVYGEGENVAIEKELLSEDGEIKAIKIKKIKNLDQLVKRNIVSKNSDHEYTLNELFQGTVSDRLIKRKGRINQRLTFGFYFLIGASLIALIGLLLAISNSGKQVAIRIATEKEVMHKLDSAQKRLILFHQTYKHASDEDQSTTPADRLVHQFNQLALYGTRHGFGGSSASKYSTNYNNSLLGVLYSNPMRGYSLRDRTVLTGKKYYLYDNRTGKKIDSKDRVQDFVFLGSKVILLRPQNVLQMGDDSISLPLALPGETIMGVCRLPGDNVLLMIKTKLDYFRPEQTELCVVNFNARSAKVVDKYDASNRYFTYVSDGKILIITSSTDQFFAQTSTRYKILNSSGTVLLDKEFIGAPATTYTASIDTTSRYVIIDQPFDRKKDSVPKIASFKITDILNGNLKPTRTAPSASMLFQDSNQTGILSAADTSGNQVFYDESLAEFGSIDKLNYDDVVSLYANEKKGHAVAYNWFSGETADTIRIVSFENHKKVRDTSVLRSIDINRLWFSRGGDSIYALHRDKKFGLKLSIFNLRMEPVLSMPIDADEQTITANFYNDLVFENQNDSIYYINLRSDKMKGLNPDNAESVSDWIQREQIVNQFRKELGDESIDKMLDQYPMNGWDIMWRDLIRKLRGS